MHLQRKVQQDDLIGATLGHYKILAPLGQGGMARVYRARQENLDREVAVKILPPWFAADPNFKDRFEREARLVARLTHPNIVTIHDFGEYAGHTYIVMQLVEGGTLKQRLDQLRVQSKTMDIYEAQPVFSRLADALSYAHDNAIVHRDVKPVNVLMDRKGRPILSDFGIAKALEATKTLTRQGAGVGTPEYMSPEQCQGWPVDGRADIYALGVMLFEALIGHLPFAADNYHALAHSHIYDMPPFASDVNPAIDSSVSQIIQMALAKSPLQRYQKAEDMGNALEYVARILRERSAADISNVATTPLYPCPQCRRFNKPNDRFCTRCGITLKPCRFCATPNMVSSRVCSRCEQPL